MTLNEYEQRFMTELEDMWNSGANCQFLNWEAFVYSMWQRLEEKEGA